MSPFLSFLRVLIIQGVAFLGEVGFLAGALSAAPGNGVVIKETSGAGQSARPFSIFRVFVQGEIANYPRPSVGGSSLSSWQSNVLTRWPDGSVQQSLISFAQSLTANGRVTISFVNDPNPCHLGNQAACDAAAPAQAGILGFNGGNWGASIETSNGTSTQSASARAIVGTGNYRFWIKGPLANIVIAEDRTSGRVYDFGWKCTANCAPPLTLYETMKFDYSSSTWAVDSTNKSLHPIFVLTQYTGWAGVKTEYILENAWMTALQDQKYDLALKSGSGLDTLKLTSTGLVHTARSRFRRTYWDGAAPGAVSTDFNFAYLIASKAIPNYDTTTVLTAAAKAAEIAAWNASDKSALFGDYLTGGTPHSARIYKAFPGTGGRLDIGLLPGWDVFYLYTMDPTLYDDVIGSGEAMGYAPNHFRESLTGRYFDSAHTVDALGRSASLDARPGFNSRDLIRTDISYPADQATLVGGISRNNWDSTNTAHQPGPVYLPYLLTGDWYFLEEMYFWAAYNLATSDVGSSCKYVTCRHDDWGYMNESWSETRGIGWSLRTVAQAAFLAPDGTPEKAYFTQKLNNNIAIREGIMNITDGSFYDASTTSKWYWGRTFLAGSRPDPLHWAHKDMGVAATGGGVNTHVDTVKTSIIEAPWQHSGYLGIAFGHIEELGFTTISPLRKAVADNLIDMIMNPAFTPKTLLAAYFMGTRNAAGVPFTTWTDVVGSVTFGDVSAAAARWTAGVMNDPVGGYPAILLGTSSFLPGISYGSYAGADAWTWMKANVLAQNYSANPMWDFVPRSTAPTSRCDLNADGVVNVIDVLLSVDQALGILPCSNADLDQNGSCEITDVLRVINAANGQLCIVGP